ncbi:unnamed protein product [Calypogeia fissa]
MAHTQGRELVADLDKLVENDPLILSYHNGPVMSGDSILVYVIYYGNFTASQRSVISDFLNSFQSHEVPSPSVADWWGLTVEYRDSRDEPVSEAVQLGGERSDSAYSRGKNLKIRDIEDLILGQVRNRKLPTDHKGIYIVLTAHDVEVEDFCKNQCASHFATKPLDATDGRPLVYAWAGNALSQCPSRCVWPFAKAEYGPRTQQPLKPPNQDAGIDGMIINIAEMIAGAATNPFNSGYYQGDAAAPLEAATACAGIFGEGAYPGEPGKLLVDQKSGASFNAHGIRDRKFMLPALWNPLDLQCTPPQSANNEKKNE